MQTLECRNRFVRREESFLVEQFHHQRTAAVKRSESAGCKRCISAKIGREEHFPHQLGAEFVSAIR